MKRGYLLGGVAALVGGVAVYFAAAHPDPVPVPVPAPVVPAPAPLSTTVWTVDNITELVPVAPPRQSTVARPIPANPAYDTALQVLGTVVEEYAGDPDNPWAVAHGLLARTANFRLTDGREAVPHLFATYAEPRPVGTLALVGFPASRGPIRIEPHTDLLLKSMGEVGVPPDATFPTSGGTASIADLYRYTLLKTFLVIEGSRTNFDGPNDMPWGLQALAQWAPPGELQWIAQDGSPMDLDALASFTVAVLTKESAFLFAAMQKGQTFTRQGQGLFTYTCGGAHLLQGASYAIARGYGTAKDRKAIEAQVPLMFYRLPIELAVYEDAMRRQPKYKTKLLVQRMKFLGHFLETMSKMQAMGLYTPDDAQLLALEGAAQNLTLTVDALRKQGTFDALPALRKTDEQLYLDVIGDSAHAIRGLEMALGRGTIGW